MTKLSIKRDLIVSLAASLLILYSLSAAGVYFFVRAKVRSQFDTALLNELRDFMGETKVNQRGMVEGEFHKIDLPRFRSGESPSFYQLWNHEGETILKSDSMPEGANLPLSVDALSGVEIFSAALPDGQPGRVALARFPPSNERDTARGRNESAPVKDMVFLGVAHSDSEVRRTLATLMSALVGSGLVLACCGVITVLVVVKRGFRALSRFAAITEELDPGNLGERLPDAEAPSELRPFLRQINAMLDRVEAGLERERRFSTSVAHELRTPVAELRSLVEVALTDCADPALREDPEDVYEAGQSIAIRMGALIDGLSQIFRDSRVAQRIPESVSARSILEAVDESIACRERDAHARGVRVRFESDDGVGGIEVMADPVLIRGILDNLVANAGVHAPENSDVSIRATCLGDREFQIEIVNLKGDLRAEDLAHLAEPFWQKDAARSDPNRFGLGLALAVSYAELMGAMLTLELEEEHFVARLRLETSPSTDLDRPAATMRPHPEVASE